MDTLRGRAEGTGIRAGCQSRRIPGDPRCGLFVVVVVVVDVVVDVEAPVAVIVQRDFSRF